MTARKSMTAAQAAARRQAATHSDADVHRFSGSYVSSYGVLVIPASQEPRAIPPRTAPAAIPRTQPAPASAPVPRPVAPAAAPASARRSPLAHLSASKVNLLFSLAGQAFQYGAGGMRSTTVPPDGDESRLVRGAIHEASHAAVAAHFGVSCSISLEADTVGNGHCWPDRAMTADQQRLFALGGFVGQTIADFGASRLSVGGLEAEFHRTKAWSPESDWITLRGYVTQHEIQQCWQILGGRWPGIVSLAATHARHAMEYA